MGMKRKKELILIGKCLGVSEENKDQIVFNFCGTYSGCKIQKVLVVSRGNGVFIKNRVYLLHLAERYISDGTLYANFIRGKTVEN